MGTVVNSVIVQCTSIEQIGCVGGWPSDHAIFLHTFTQKLQNAWSWKLACKCSLV